MEDIEKIEKLCESLKMKDPNFLKHLNDIGDNTKDIIVKIVDKVVNEEYDGRDAPISLVISELILRYLTLKQPTSLPKKLKGPSFLYVMKHKTYPQIIYLFGEQHMKRGIRCADSVIITQFIREIMFMSPVFVDIYLETPYKHKGYDFLGISSFGEYLGDIEESLKECIYLDKSIEKSSPVCRTSRIHSIDIRRIMKSDKERKGYALLHEGFYGTLKKWGKKEHQKVRDYLTYIYEKDSIIYRKIRKQIDNIKNLGLRSDLENGFEECIEGSADLETLLKINPNPKTSVTLAQTKLKLMANKLFIYSSCLMDYYFITRMFRTYDKRSGEYNWPSYNNIIYSGDMHTKNYLVILEGLGFRITESAEDEVYSRDGKIVREQCLDVSKIKPFFHQRY